MTSSLYPTDAVPRIIGGAEIFARELAEQFTVAGHEVEVIRAQLAPGQDQETLNGVVVHSAPVHNIFRPYGQAKWGPFRGLWHALDDRARADAVLSQTIARFQPDVLHSNTLSGLGADIWRVAKRMGVPVVHTLHDYYLTCPRCSRFNKGRSCDTTCHACRLLTIARRAKTRYVDGLVGVSQRIIDIHLKEDLFRDTPIRTVVRNAARPMDGIGARTGNGQMSFGFIGRVTEEKGVNLLLSAFADLPPSAARLVIAGRIEEADKKALRALAPEAEIEFLGFVEAADFYRQVDVVVVPSIWEEPGPLVAQEALAAARPIVGMPFGGIPEQIETGINGWISEPTVEGLGRIIRDIVAMPEKVASMQRDLLGKATRRSFRDVMNDYLAIYARVRTLPGPRAS